MHQTTRRLVVLRIWTTVSFGGRFFNKT